jgi:hypothetical protein
MMTHEDLKRLAAASGPCLTIFQPLRDNYLQVTKPATRIVAAVQAAGRLLEEKGYDSSERDEMLRPLMKVASSVDWTGRKGSLVMFRAPDFTVVDFWPDTLAPRVHFGPEFLVLPLLPGLLSKRDFWLLGISIKAVRLFRGSSEALVEVALPAGVPVSLSEHEEFDQPDHTLRARSGAGRSNGSMKGVQFGTSTAHELKGDYLHDFFKAINRGIHPTLAEDPKPLILAGVTRELAIYRTVNTYSPLLTGAIHGSPDSLGAGLLYTKATELMSAYSARADDTTLRVLEEAGNRGLVVSDPAALIEAAAVGQVEELIVPPASQAPGQHEEAVNWAALATIRNSGTIRVLNDPRVAQGAVGILRFPRSGPSFYPDFQQTEPTALVH